MKDHLVTDSKNTFSENFPVHAVESPTKIDPLFYDPFCFILMLVSKMGFHCTSCVTVSPVHSLLHCVLSRLFLLPLLSSNFTAFYRSSTIIWQSLLQSSKKEGKKKENRRKKEGKQKGNRRTTEGSLGKTVEPHSVLEHFWKMAFFGYCPAQFWTLMVMSNL